jgi:hypothetical protein
MWRTHEHVGALRRSWGGMLGPEHHDPELNRELPAVELLDAEWKSGPACAWVWQRPTRVSGFEIESPGGDLLSIMVGNEEQLMTGPVALMDLAQYWPQGVPESPLPGWKIGRILLPSMRAGVVLHVATRAFSGRLRPFGVDIPP